MKKIFIWLLMLFVAKDAYAAEVELYFAWEIENSAAYTQSRLALLGIDIDRVNIAAQKKADNKLFAYDMNIGDIYATRDKVYGMIERGEYSDAVTMCEMIAAYQKILFGTDYFDAGLTELTAKLYLEADELEAAEREINLQTAKAFDSATKIRAMNLRAELLNRRGKFSEAFELTEAVADLLKTLPDATLSLINQSRAARALNGLGDVQKSTEIAEEMQDRP